MRRKKILAAVIGEDKKQLFVHTQNAKKDNVKSIL